MPTTWPRRWSPIPVMGLGPFLRWIRSEGLIKPPDTIDQMRSTMQRRGLLYAYDLAEAMVADTGHGAGAFFEMDLPADLRMSSYAPETVMGALTLEDVRRDPGQNQASVVTGRVVVRTERFSEGMERVVIINEGSKDPS